MVCTLPTVCASAPETASHNPQTYQTFKIQLPRWFCARNGCSRMLETVNRPLVLCAASLSMCTYHGSPAVASGVLWCPCAVDRNKPWLQSRQWCTGRNAPAVLAPCRSWCRDRPASTWTRMAALFPESPCTKRAGDQAAPVPFLLSA